MKIIAKTGNDKIATVYVAETGKGKLVEFVESVQPPIPREKKWVLIVSTLFGCPVKCRFCDAGAFYNGKLTTDEILEQLFHMVNQRFSNRQIDIPKFKIQFARMGEPALNPAVLDVLAELPSRLMAPGLMPTISSIAPKGSDSFFRQLLQIKSRYYRDRFQLQFSIHTTDEEKRNWLIPVTKWSFDQIAACGETFYTKGERKITLNFALAENIPVDPNRLIRYFDPDIFFIKLTPVNPTGSAKQNQISSQIKSNTRQYPLVDRLKDLGYDVLLSIGELEENLIGSNCGQHIMNYLAKRDPIEDAYTYSLKNVETNLVDQIKYS